MALQHRGVNNKHVLTIWDMRQHKVCQNLTGEVIFVSALAFSPDGRQITEVGGYGRVETWNAAQGRVMRKLTVD